MYSNTSSKNPKFEALSEIIETKFVVYLYQGSAQLDRIGQIRSDFIEKVTDQILFSREGHRSDPIFFKNRSNRFKTHCFKLFSFDFRDKN